jgi:hypothetical protein
MFEELMRMKNSCVCWFLALSAAFFFQSLAWSQANATLQSVAGQDKAIVIRERGQDHSYHFEDDLQLSEIEQVKLLFQNQSHGKLYLLTYVEGSSTGGGNGPCGSGRVFDLAGARLQMGTG